MNIISTAQAAAESPVSQAGGLADLGLIFFFIIVFYFLLWRPQSKRQKEHAELIGGLQKGDEVVTNGGVLGKIQTIKDDFLTILISDGVQIMIQKHAVSHILPKGTMKSLG